VIQYSGDSIERSLLVILKTRLIKYKNIKALNTDLLYAIAAERAAGQEIACVALENTELSETFKNSASKILKSLKRDGYIRLFVFESELLDSDKMETVYMQNKFPFLSQTEGRESVIYIKL
jgi:hypothetical protein